MGSNKEKSIIAIAIIDFSLKTFYVSGFFLVNKIKVNPIASCIPFIQISVSHKHLTTHLLDILYLILYLVSPPLIIYNINISIANKNSIGAPKIQNNFWCYKIVDVSIFSLLLPVFYRSLSFLLHLKQFSVFSLLLTLHSCSLNAITVSFPLLISSI